MNPHRDDNGVERTVRSWTIAAAVLLAGAALLVLVVWDDRLSDDAERHVAHVALVLIGAALLSVVVAALLGPRPFWQDPDAPRRSDDATVVLVTVSALIAGAYLWWSLPWFEDGGADPVMLVGGAVCVAAATRAARVPVAGFLFVVGGFLLFIGSGEAFLILFHGALAIGLLAATAAIFRTERPWVRTTAAVFVALGVPAWLYLGFLVLVFFGCGSGSACVY